MANRGKAFFLVLAITVFSLVVYPGYQVFVADQSEYLPKILNEVHPSLYQNDQTIGYSLAGYTPLYEVLLVFSIGKLGIDATFAIFFLTFVFRLLLFYCVFGISRLLLSDENFGFLSTALFLVPMSIYGSSVPVLDLYLVPRIAALGFGLLSLLLAMRNKYFYSSVALSLSALFNPSYSAVFFLLFYWRLVENRKTGITSNEFVAAFIIPALTAVLLLEHLKSTGAPFFFTQDWLSAISHYYGIDHVFFVTTRSLADLALLCLSALLIAATRSRKLLASIPEQKKAFFVRIAAACLALVAASVAGADLLRIVFVAQLQLSRGLVLVKIIAVMVAAFMVFSLAVKARKGLAESFAKLGMLAYLVMPSSLYAIPFFASFAYLGSRPPVETSDRPITNEDLKALTVFSLFTLLVTLYGTWLLLKVFTAGETVSIILNNLSTIVTVFGAAVIFWKLPKIGDEWLSRITAGGAALMLLSSIALFPSFSILQPASKDHGFMEACNWVKINTGASDVFIPTKEFDQGYSPMLQMACQRPLYASIIGLSEEVFVAGTGRFAERQKIFDALPDLNSSFLKSKGISYVISTKGLKEENFGHPVFSNGRFYIYKT